MRTSFLHKTLFLAALVLGVYSCNKDGNDVPKPNVVEATKNVTLKFSTKPTTYAEGPVVGTAIPTINSGTIYFVAGTSVVSKIDFTAEEAATLSGAGKSYPAPGTATGAYIVANAGGTASLPTMPAGTGLLATLKQTLLSIDAQANPTTQIALQGEGNIVANAVKVNLYPAVARIEIGTIVGKSADVSIPLAGFTLEGIFINNTFKKQGFDFTAVGTGNEVNFGPSDGAEFVESYPTALRDYAVAGLGGTGLTKSIADVWGYQVFPTTVPAKAGAGLVPQIILKVKDVTFASADAQPLLYLTVTKFKKDDVVINAFQPGFVYTIASIAFGGEHLTEQPAISAKQEVTVTVEVKPWVPVGITPDI